MRAIERTFDGESVLICRTFQDGWDATCEGRGGTVPRRGLAYVAEGRDADTLWRIDSEAWSPQEKIGPLAHVARQARAEAHELWGLGEHDE